MRHSSLAEWLNSIKKNHPIEIDLSLERVTEVARRLDLLNPLCPIITVGGTNGKGSCVAGLEAIYLAQGYRVGAFTTPFLLRHNEQVRIQGADASDEAFCQAYEQIDHARGDVSLTLFEFNTLAAFILFKQAKLDVWLLEVGLGGRWDAVNAMDTDLAVITSVGIDHADWLGNTREQIAGEKAGIFRSEKPVVCGDFNPPYALIHAAEILNSPFYCQGKEFEFEKQSSSWTWKSDKKHFENLPLSQLALQNMSTVLMGIELMQWVLPVTSDAIYQGLSQVKLPGRIQVLPGKVTRVFDVSHNPSAAEYLADWIESNPTEGKTRAVFSMLADKDIISTLCVMKEQIDHWYTAPIMGDRSTSLATLDYCFRKTNITNVNSYSSVKDSYQSAMNHSEAGDRIIVFGSFRTVAEVLAHSPEPRASASVTGGVCAMKNEYNFSKAKKNPYIHDLPSR